MFELLFFVCIANTTFKKQCKHLNLCNKFHGLLITRSVSKSLPMQGSIKEIFLQIIALEIHHLLSANSNQIPFCEIIHPLENW